MNDNYWVIFAVLGGTFLLGCGEKSENQNQQPAGGTAGASAGAGSGGSSGAAPGTGGSSGAGGLAGSGGAPDVGMFRGLTGLRSAVALINSGYCVADQAGIVTCDISRQRPPTATPFATFGLGLDAAGESGCGLTEQGEARCWGSAVGSPPPGAYTAISVGDDNACGVRPNGSLTCFGDDDALDEPPLGQFSDVSVDDDYACALATAGHIECWGPRASSRGIRVDGAFRQVALGGSVRCTLDTAGAVDCQPTQRGTPPAAGPFTRVAPSSQHVCALREDGSVACWGESPVARLAPPAGPFNDIASYAGSVCARTEAGAAECWGGNYGDGGSILDCETSQTALSGTLGGDAFSLDTYAGRQASFEDGAGFRWTFRTYTSTGDVQGLIVLDGNEELSGGPELALANGESVPLARALLQVGASETDPGDFFCSASGSSATLDIDELEVELNNVHALGGCSGTPVTGELVLCTRCQTSLSGTAEDRSFDLTHGQGANVGALAGFTALYMDDTTYAAVEKADDGTVTWGIVVTSRGGPGGGAVYCAGPGSTWAVTDDGSGTISTLTGLSRLPDCPASASSDAVAGCIR